MTDEEISNLSPQEVEDIYGSAFLELVEAARTNYLAFYSLFALRPDKPKIVEDFQESLCNLVQDVLEQKNGRGQETDYLCASAAWKD